MSKSKTGGCITNIVKYYKRHAEKDGKRSDGKPHHYHNATCIKCGARFKVYHYYRLKWTAVNFCSTECYWDHRKSTQKATAARKREEAEATQDLYSMCTIQ